MFYDAGEKAFEELWRGDDKPDAIFCINDLLAFGVLDAARSQGIKVPEDLWVIGYNDIQMSTWAAYDLTTVRQPLGQMAEMSVRLLMKRIDGGSSVPPQRQRIEGSLIVRGSTGHAPVGSGRAKRPSRGVRRPEPSPSGSALHH